QSSRRMPGMQGGRQTPLTFRMLGPNEIRLSADFRPFRRLAIAPRIFIFCRDPLESDLRAFRVFIVESNDGLTQVFILF
ncbi:MAG: hypothetical protein V4523_19995, partial [Pseudomonadota bacterium]